MRILEEMCEVKLQEEYVKLKNQADWLRNSLIRIKRCIQTDDLTYALAIINTTLEATNQSREEETK